MTDLDIQMTDLDIQMVLVQAQANTLEALEALQLAQAQIAILEAERDLLRLALAAEGERIYREFEKRYAPEATP